MTRLARLGARIAVFALFAAAHVAAARLLIHAYPSTYPWTELLVDYQGGFTKRGLLGEIAFRAQGVTSPARLVPYLLFAAYLSATGILLFAFRVGDAFAGLLFLLSPAGWIFPLVNPGAYGRKDAFVVAAFAAALWVAGSRLNRTAALLATMAIFAAAGLLVETSWFYYPLAFAALLARRPGAPRAWRLGAAAAAAAYTLGCLVLTLRAPHVDTAAIAASWPGGPYADPATGALCCLNFGFGEATEVARAGLPTLPSTAAGAGLGAIPLALLLAERAPFRIDRLAAAAALAGMACALFPALVAADWGRYAYLWLTATFLWAWACPPRPPGGPRAALGAYDVALRAALLLVYASTWQLVHYQDPGRSALIPGLLFRAFGATGGLSDPN